MEDETKLQPGVTNPEISHPKGRRGEFDKSGRNLSVDVQQPQRCPNPEADFGPQDDENKNTEAIDRSSPIAAELSQTESIEALERKQMAIKRETYRQALMAQIQERQKRKLNSRSRRRNVPSEEQGQRFDTTMDARIAVAPKESDQRKRELTVEWQRDLRLQVEERKSNFELDNTARGRQKADGEETAAG